ncbi:hypothetical protein EC991_006952 [Linnemannia zychae]|nr:hypothetical protein EC991_006952 [Linnemannia zychae]
MSETIDPTHDENIDAILPLINSGRISKGIKPIGITDSSVYASAIPAMIPCLLALNQGTLGPTQFPNVFRVCIERSTLRGKIQFYLRLLTITRANLTQYATDFTADSAWANALLQLEAEGANDDLSTFYSGVMQMDHIRRAIEDANSSLSRTRNISKSAHVVSYVDSTDLSLCQ